MLEGLPDFFSYVIGLSTEARSRPCGSLAVVLHHLLWDVVNSADVALHHYFPLTFDQPFLQSSSLGTPYQKWAKFTDEDFRKVDECIRRVVRASFCAYEEVTMVLADDHSKKDAWHWFHSVYTQYASCSVSGKRPVLTLSALNLEGWLEPGEYRFAKVVNRLGPRPPAPPIVTLTAREIEDCAVIAELHQDGGARVRELRVLSHDFGRWLREHCTMDELTAPHHGTFSDTWLG